MGREPSAPVPARLQPPLRRPSHPLAAANAAAAAAAAAAGRLPGRWPGPSRAEPLRRSPTPRRAPRWLPLPSAPSPSRCRRRNPGGSTCGGLIMSLPRGVWCHDTPRGRQQEYRCQINARRLLRSPRCLPNVSMIRCIGQLAQHAQLDDEIDRFSCARAIGCANVTRQHMLKDRSGRTRAGCSSCGGAAQLRVQGRCAVARDAGDAAKRSKGIHSSP